MNKMGVDATVSSADRRDRLSGGGLTDLSPRTSQTKFSSAVWSLSGRRAWTTRTRWKARVLDMALGGKSASHVPPFIHRVQASPSEKLSAVDSVGNTDTSLWKAGPRSLGTQGGTDPSDPPITCPTRNSHSFSLNRSGCNPCTRWMANVSLLSLNKLLPTYENTVFLRADSSPVRRLATSDDCGADCSVSLKSERKVGRSNWYM
mmetsp:Transcript_10834/g.24571  ORF Transcript_10834/g.24571 Transcript_10834/m.24571 type:complete len:204 (+) Transcript_10834:1698-2309(+)